MDFDRRKAARPHVVRAVIGFLIALGGTVLENIWEFQRGGGFTFDDKIGLLGVLTFVVGGVILVRSIVRGIHAAAADRLRGKTKGTPVSFLVYGLGYLVVVLGALGMTGTSPGSLLFGGALTGVIIGIAAQQTLGNFFAGIVLIFVRPFSVGDRIYLKGGIGEYEGDVGDMTLFYVHISTDRGEVMLPNAGVLASAVGPGARAEKEKERQESSNE